MLSGSERNRWFCSGFICSTVFRNVGTILSVIYQPLKKLYDIIRVVQDLMMIRAVGEESADPPPDSWLRSFKTWNAKANISVAQSETEVLIMYRW